MKKLKFTLFLLIAVLAVSFSKAQSIEDGKRFLYYEKYISAKNAFQQLVSANPGNAEAAYWLGQTLIRSEDQDLAAAKEVYRKALEANSNNPLLIAGMGHIELLEGKTQDARNRFETALSLSQGKNIAVLNAIGFANADFDSKLGDAAYAVEKLKQATNIKGFRDPEVLTNLGDAYRKVGDGGSAQRSYEAALAIDPKYARAAYRLGRIYQSQGTSQQDIFMRYYNQAIAMDPNYTPVYFTLHQYFYETDVVKSAQYLDKYLAAKGSDEKNSCYLNAQMKFAQGLFAETITAADQCIGGNANPYPNLYGLKGYAYFKIGEGNAKSGDSASAKTAFSNAKSAFEMYFQKQKPEKLGPRDYSTYAKLLLKFAGNEAVAAQLTEKAVMLDTLESNRASYVKELAQVYEAQKNTREAAKWYGKVISVKKNYSNVDLFNAGYNYYVNNAFDSSNRYFNLYVSKYPDDILGYYMLGNAAAIIDSTGAQGLAVPYYQRAIQIGEADPTKANAKTRLMNAYKFFVGYYYNVKKRQDSALVYVDKALALDPTDAQMIANKEFISKNDPNAPVKKQPATKPKSQGTQKRK